MYISRAVLSLALVALAAPAPAQTGQTTRGQAMRGQVTRGQVTVRQRVMIRIRQMPPPRLMPRPIELRETRGPTCIPAAELAGALLSSRDRIDLVLRGGKRVRAQLERDCRGLDYYRGFYVKPSADGMICADRDVVRSRAGGKCPIDRFRTLEPVTPKIKR